MLLDILMVVEVFVLLVMVYFDWDTWRMNKSRWIERAQWREAKRKAALKKETSGGKPPDAAATTNIQSD